MYQLKITLQNSKPLVWRRILVPETYTFFDLHVAIQDAMVWTDHHLHQFCSSNPNGQNRDPEYLAFPDPQADYPFGSIPLDERKIHLNEWLKNPKDQVYYEYDFGDYWVHKITLEKIVPKKIGEKYPTIVGGEEACPPEDCGGLGGYYDLLRALGNPKHPEYQDMIRWMGLKKGSDFDPHLFDPAEVKFRNPKKVLKAYEKGFKVRPLNKN